MSIDWSLLVPGLIIAVVTGASVGGYLDLSRRVEERRHARRRFTREAPVAVSAAHELLIAGIAKDPTSLVPPAEFANALREQAARLQGGTRRQMAALPAIDMVREMDRALEDLAVRGRALDLRLEHAMAAAPQTLEHKLVLKLAKQAIQKDPTPADAIPRIDNAEAHAAMTGDPAVVADIIRYRRAQQLLHDARDAFVDHWWTVRDLRLSAETRLATSRHEGGGGRRAAAAIEREVADAMAADFLRNWARIDHGISIAEVAELPAPVDEPTPAAPETAPQGPAAKPGRTRL